MPSRKEIQWSQLRVGSLVLAALAALVGLIFLMSGSTGGLFAKKINLRCYFKNASGLKEGAPVTLEGVTIGNVKKIRVVPARNPYPVEVTMELAGEYRGGLHTDSTAVVTQAGVLGDSFVDIDSTRASGPIPGNNAELVASGSPTLQDVISSSQDSIQSLQGTIAKLNKTLDALNSNRGTVGRLLNDPQFADHFEAIAANLETMTKAISSGQGTMGKLINDDTLYNHLNSAVDKLDQITTALNDSKGSAGKFLPRRLALQQPERRCRKTPTTWSHRSTKAMAQSVSSCTTRPLRKSLTTPSPTSTESSRVSTQAKARWASLSRIAPLSTTSIKLSTQRTS